MKCPECLQPAEHRGENEFGEVWVCIDEECDFFEQSIEPQED